MAEIIGDRGAGPILCLSVCWVAATVVASPLSAAAPRVLSKGFLPEDRRLEDLKDYSGYFPFEPIATPEAWARRAERVRRQILVAAGLWPMPTATPAEAVVHGLVDRGDYTVEKVYFQSIPGLYVTGNLYRPKGKTGRLPGVLCPHGHWDGGRFFDCGPRRFASTSCWAKSGSRKAGVRCCKPAACSWPGWGRWCFTTTCWATPTACKSHCNWRTGSPRSGPIPCSGHT